MNRQTQKQRNKRLHSRLAEIRLAFSKFSKIERREKLLSGKNIAKAVGVGALILAACAVCAHVFADSPKQKLEVPADKISNPIQKTQSNETANLKCVAGHSASELEACKENALINKEFQKYAISVARTGKPNDREYSERISHLNASNKAHWLAHGVTLPPLTYDLPPANEQTGSGDLAQGGKKRKYLAAGRLLGDPPITGRNYAWDAENRLIQITYPGTSNYTSLTYDPLGRCVKIVETGTSPSYSGNATKQFVWSGTEMCEERDSSSNVAKQFFPWGEIVGGTTYYYEFDHRGDIVGVVNSSGVEVTSISYNPWGVPTVLYGTVIPDFGFCGMYKHGRSGLNLTLHRPYSATLGRWLSRDPLGESAGVNLYAYCDNDPINNIDPSGLDVYVLDKPFSAVGPLGHIGELIGTPETGYQSFTFTSTGHSPIGPGQVIPGKYSTLDKAFAALYPQGYRRALDLHTSPAQDAAAIAAAQSWAGHPYSIIGSSCSNQTKATVRATGLPVPRGPFNFLPRNEFKTMSKAALSGKLGVPADMIDIPAPQ